jgi:L,D-transpeptidase catalytic domain
MRASMLGPTTARRAWLVPVSVVITLAMFSLAAPVSRAASKSAAKPAAKATGTTALANNPKKLLNQWETLAASEWPAALDAIRADARGKQILVFRRPDNRSAYIQLDQGKSAAGEIVFLAVGRQGDWIRVLLPYLPNGSVGWVHEKDVRFFHVAYRVIVEKDRNLLTVETDRGTLLTAKVSTGTNNTPTPTGLFYIREIVIAKDQTGPFGPVVLGLSGLSTSLKTFSGGFGRLALHGTDTPSALGTDSSNGCVRLDNPTIVKLSKLLPLGTPVEIVRTRSDLRMERSPSVAWTHVPVEEAIVSEPALDTVPNDTTPRTLPEPPPETPVPDPNP